MSLHPKRLKKRDLNPTLSRNLVFSGNMIQKTQKKKHTKGTINNLDVEIELSGGGFGVAIAAFWLWIFLTSESLLSYILMDKRIIICIGEGSIGVPNTIKV